MPGPFDAIQTMMGRPDPQQQLAAALGQGPGQPGSPAGPQPLAQGGGSPPGGGGPPGDPGGPPGGPQQQGQQQQPQQPQILQTPPDLAQAYMTLMQRDQSSNQFYNGLALLDAGMYPGRHPEAAMRWAQGMQQDPASLFNGLVQVRQMQQQQASLDAFQRSAPDAAKQLGVTTDEVLAYGPEAIKSMLDAQRQAQAPTEAMKNANAAAAAYKSANPDASDADVADYKANVLAQTVSNMDPATRAWANAVRVFRSDPDNKGKPLPPEMKDPLTYSGAVTEQGKVVAQAGEERASAITSYPTIAPVWENAVKNVDWLTNPTHKDAVAFAIQHPLLSSTALGSTIGGYTVGQDALDARGYLDTLGNQQFRSGMQDVKNVRTQSEANKIGGSMTNLDRATNSQKVIDDELARLKDLAYRGYATVTAAAGKQVPYKFKGMADPTYLKPGPFYNGGTEEAPPDNSGGGGGGGGGGGKPMPDATKSAAQALIAKDPSQRGPLIQHLRDQGIDPTGL